MDFEKTRAKEYIAQFVQARKRGFKVNGLEKKFRIKNEKILNNQLKEIEKLEESVTEQDKRITDNSI